MSCGERAHRTFRDASLALCDDDSSLDTAYASLVNLLTVVYEEMKSSRRDCWHYLYTEISIILSLIDVLKGRGAESVSQLDRAIIIAGPAGVGRHDLILSLITQIQHSCLTQQPWIAGNDKDHGSQARCKKFHLRSANNEIPSLAPPSMAAFRSSLSNQPFILRGFANHWPAFDEHPWHSFDYLRHVAGASRVVPVEVGFDYRTEEWAQKIMSWDEFLTQLQQLKAPSETLYLAQHGLFRQFPSLQNDIVVPDYVYAGVGPSESYPDYVPPSNDEQLVINSWFGPQGTMSPAHTVSSSIIDPLSLLIELLGSLLQFL
jgi:hypothetical protein